jgi:hypothetical protein
LNNQISPQKDIIAVFYLDGASGLRNFLLFLSVL